MKNENMQSFIMFENGKSKKMTGLIYEHGVYLEDRDILYQFYNLKEFLYGDVLFLNLENNILYPLLPIVLSKTPVAAEASVIQELQSEIEEYRAILADAQRTINSGIDAINSKIDQFRKFVNDSKKVAYFTEQIIKDAMIYVDNEPICAKIDTGANISVAKRLPSNAKFIGKIPVESIDKKTSMNSLYEIPIQINGRKLMIEAIHRPSLSAEFLIPLTVLSRAGIRLESLIENVAEAE